MDRATVDSANMRKEAELTIKEDAIRHKETKDKEMNKMRDELREREKSLDKRQSSIEQQAEDLRKRESIVEATQRRLAERLDATNKKTDELNKLVDMERQTLHELSGLDEKQATSRLMTMLESDMQQETGAIVLRYKREMEDTIQPRPAS